MKNELVTVFIEKLNKEDPPHVLLLLGVTSAANWLVLLNSNERKIVFEFIESELNKKGDLPVKELLVKVLQMVGGLDSLKLINKLINEGAKSHGKYLILDAENAKVKLKQ